MKLAPPIQVRFFHISKDRLSDVLFTDDGRSILLCIVGESFGITTFGTKDTNNFLFVPKVFLKPVYTGWDEMENKDIRSLLPHNVIAPGAQHPKNQKSVYRIVRENDDKNIVDIGKMMAS